MLYVSSEFFREMWRDYATKSPTSYSVFSLTLVFLQLSFRITNVFWRVFIPGSALGDPIRYLCWFVGFQSFTWSKYNHGKVILVRCCFKKILNSLMCFLDVSANLCNLKVEDEVLSVNGKRLKFLSHEAIVNLMSDAIQSGNICLRVNRSGIEGFLLRSYQNPEALKAKYLQ